MSTISPFLSIDSPSDKALQFTRKKLSNAGLRSVQTFDLQTARLAAPDCSCPHHGTTECDCQMIVLLVYGEQAEPATLTLHGNDGKTWVSITDNASRRADEKLLEDIRRALKNEPSVDG